MKPSKVLSGRFYELNDNKYLKSFTFFTPSLCCNLQFDGCSLSYVNISQLSLLHALYFIIYIFFIHIYQIYPIFLLLLDTHAIDTHAARLCYFPSFVLHVLLAHMLHIMSLLWYRRLTGAWVCAAPTAAPRRRPSGGATTRASPSATHADSTSSCTASTDHWPCARTASRPASASPRKRGRAATLCHPHQPPVLLGLRSTVSYIAWLMQKLPQIINIARGVYCNNWYSLWYNLGIINRFGKVYSY